MNELLSRFAEPGPFRAVLLREIHAALINRYFQVFAVLSLLGGLTAVFFSETVDAVDYYLIQLAIFLVSLFALLAGVSSAQAEREEWQLMFAQPVPRGLYVVGKFAAYIAIITAVLVLLFTPALFAGTPPGRAATLYLQTLLLAATFLALGLAAGFVAHDRAQALIMGIGAWLFLLIGVDLAGLFAARFASVQGAPDLWVAVLMLNPLDAFRIKALFALEQIPAEAANKTPLASWWILHGGLWFYVIAALWSVTLVALAGFRLNRLEE